MFLVYSGTFLYPDISVNMIRLGRHTHTHVVRHCGAPPLSLPRHIPLAPQICEPIHAMWILGGALGQAKNLLWGPKNPIQLQIWLNEIKHKMKLINKH